MTIRQVVVSRAGIAAVSLLPCREHLAAHVDYVDVPVEEAGPAAVGCRLFPGLREREGIELSAEGKRMSAVQIPRQECVAELAVRVMFSHQPLEFSGHLVSLLELRRRNGKELAPVWPHLEWRKLPFDHRQHLAD